MEINEKQFVQQKKKYMFDPYHSIILKKINILPYIVYALSFYKNV